MSWHDRMEAFMKSERRSVLKEQRRQAKERSAAFKRASGRCGAGRSQRKRPGATFEDEDNYS